MLSSDLSPAVVYDDLAAAAERLRGAAHLTPVLTSRTVDQRTGHQVFFKCENFQRTGSFKFRGAYNAMSQLEAAQRQQGVLAYSSGNHAQAMALSGSLLGISTTILMPNDAPAVKQAATRGYGAELLLYDRRVTSREALAQQLCAERGTVMIPPYDHPQVVAGQGTVGKELFEQVGELDVLLVCCGGGGLLSGCAIAASELSPGCQVIGVEPAAGDDVTRSFVTRTIQTVHNPDTIADGARTPCPGQVTFPLILQHVQAMLTVTDEQLLRAMFLLWERLKLVVEPTGALATAALLEGLVDPAAARVGVVISGGNVDLKSDLFERFKAL
ncbi:MAG: threo-3-hydroxy-L-aspartate ammonia-lyase [Pegethrix bostrychoides GSE-TBD4-15B]|uniref:threonine ammonia-lyase n=1 Tax=Pegethrix bostrychoides GSE-TBD4-15B TaxID=2839662 RepID=A0A951PBX5_9CYAN|nr:threo-3-hydroxy-L-aspartate ammonia-lyase [Pegethrix bostrychoides GSE-TBD4-15B]